MKKTVGDAAVSTITVNINTFMCVHNHYGDAEVIKGLSKEETEEQIKDWLDYGVDANDISVYVQGPSVEFTHGVTLKI